MPHMEIPEPRKVLPALIVLVSLLGAISVQADPPGHIWSSRFGAGGSEHATRVAVDQITGDIYLTGYFSGSVDFGGGALHSSGPTDIFLVRFNPDGGHVWSQRFGGVSDDIGYDIDVDGSGNVYLAGAFKGTVDFGGGPLVAAGGTSSWQDAFLVKFEPDGTHVWSQRFGDTTGDRATGVGVDDAGNVCLSGWFSQTVSFGGAAFTSSGSSDMFVAAFDANGAHQWSHAFGGSSSDTGDDVAMTSSGEVLLTGSFQGTADFGGGALVSAGGTDIVLARFDPSGSHLWSQRFGGTSDDSGLALAVDSDDAVALTGRFFNAVDFGGGVLVGAGGGDTFVAVFDAGGTHQWSRAFDDAFADLGTGIDIAPTGGGVLLTGYFTGDIDLGGGTLSSVAGYDVFVAGYDGSGAHEWSAAYGETDDQFAWDVAFGDPDTFVLTGEFWNDIDFGGGPLTSDGFTDIFLAHLRPPALAGVADAGGFDGRARVVGHPNPFTARTTVDYTVADAGPVRVAIFDARGAQVTLLVNGVTQMPGSYRVAWNGRSSSGALMPSGVYFARISQGRSTRTGKVTLGK